MIGLSSYDPIDDCIYFIAMHFLNFLHCNYCYASQVLEIIQLEGHAHSPEESSVMWKNIHLLQVFSSMPLGDYS